MKKAALSILLLWIFSSAALAQLGISKGLIGGRNMASLSAADVASDMKSMTPYAAGLVSTLPKHSRNTKTGSFDPVFVRQHASFRSPNLGTDLLRANHRDPFNASKRLKERRDIRQWSVRPEASGGVRIRSNL